MRVLTLFLALIAGLLLASQHLAGNIVGANGEAPGDSPSLDHVLAQLATHNEQRDAALTGYSAARDYEAENGFTHTHAQMQVRMRFHRRRGKDFTIVGEDGSKIVRSHVFRPALEVEKEAAEATVKQRSDITTNNYEFTLVGEQDLRDRHCFVLEARPKRKDKFLMRSHVWVDSEDYALVRVRGELVKLPSFWTRRVEFTRDYQKVGGFWLPMHDQSVSQLRIFGKATLRIRYYDYLIEPITASEIVHPAATSVDKH